MAKDLLNEAERFLLEQWGEAHLLEEAMEGVRTKYREVFQKIVEAVTAGHPELDAQRAYVTQFWGSGCIGFGRKAWPGGQSNWPSGLWVWNLRLEMLAGENSMNPSASIWVAKKHKLDFDAARAAVSAAAKEILTPEELKGSASEKSGESLFWLPAPSRSELLGALSDGDGQGFVKLFVSQFELMARFVPVLEKVFQEHVNKAE